MVDAGMSQNMQSWTNDINNIGRVEIKTSFKSLNTRLIVVIAVITGFVIRAYQVGDVGTRGLTIAIVGFAALIIGCIVFVKKKWGDQSFTIERDSVVTVSGQRILWSDITNVSVYQAPRSGAALMVNLTEEAWNGHLNSQGRAGRMMHGANKFITRNRGLVQPEYLDAPPAELANWMNQFVRGEDSESS